MNETARRAAVVILLTLGAGIWFLIGDGRGMGAVRWILFAAAIVVGLLPLASRRVVQVLDRVRNPSQSAMEKTALLVGVLASCYFIFTAFYQQRDLFPKTHDEGSYLLGMQMLAHGRLWMPQHELADFFETFYVIVKPVYASLYFPGTALMYAPTIWLNWPTWVLPVVASGAIVGLVYSIVTKLLDGVAGLLAAMLMASLSWFRMLSILLFSQVPTLLLGLLMIWAWLRWRESKRAGWLAAVGVFAGWGAITRPVDAIAFALPVGVAILFELLRDRTSAKTTLPGAATMIVLGAIPFLTLQLVFNKGVTGRFFQTPYTYYLERDQPQTSFGFHTFDRSARPQSRLAQKNDYYRSFMHPTIERHQPARLLSNWLGRDDALKQKAYERPRLPMLVDSTVPFRMLLPVALAGLVGLNTSGRRVVLATLVLLVVGYLPNTFFLEHYAVVAAPAMILLIVLGGEALATASGRWQDSVRSSFTLGVLTASLLSTFESNPLTTLLDREDEHARRRHSIDDETFRSATLETLHTQLDALVEKPAVVLFKYQAGVNTIEEPVYNNAAAWPDDQAIIRAHDLGDRNVEIARYYAKKQPERTFYRFDRSTMTLTPLGTAPSLLAELAARANASRTKTTPRQTPEAYNPHLHGHR